MESLTQKIRAELTAPGTLDEQADRLSRLLAPDYLRAERGVRYAVKVATDRERLIYLMGLLLRDDKTAPSRAMEALIKMGYSTAAVDRLIEMGEPSSSLL